MSFEAVSEWIRENAAIFAGVLALIALLSYGLFLRNTDETSGGSSTPLAPRESELKQLLDAAADASEEEVSSVEATEAMVADYDKKVVDDPASADAPGYLAAMGNLNLTRLGKYAEAARCYERLLKEYPAWEGINAIYPQLISAYDLAGEHLALLKLLEEMMRQFPPESAEHQYAAARLAQLPDVS